VQSKSPASSRPSYEQQRFDHLLSAQKLTQEPLPQGKRIAFVRIVRDDVFVSGEFWPVWLNRVHGLTRESIVRRELLFAEGGAYDDARIEETMRNLRGMGIFSLVHIAAVKTGRSDEVGVLVQTRDQWSLRIEDNFSITRGVVNNLLLRLVERNVLGRNQAVGVDYILVPQSYQLAQDYYARRIASSSLALQERVGLVLNQQRNRIEGELASFAFGQPYYRLNQRFAWEASFLHDNRVLRNTSDGLTRLYPLPSVDAHGPFAQEVYRRRSQRATLLGFWRAGQTLKHTLGVGWDYRALRAQPIDETELPAALRAAFAADVLPNGRTDSGPSLSYELFRARWATFINLVTYGQSENVRVGPHLAVSTRAPLRAFGSTHNAWVLAGELGLTLAPAGFLLDMKARGSFRQQGRWIDQYCMFQLRGATPVFSIFRFAARGFLELRRHDSQRTNVTLGGDNGLRGYRSQAFVALGGDRLLGNFELRTLPLVWKTVHIGAVLFYDVGAVFPRPSAMQLHHAVGIGIRFLLPQFNSLPSSFDGGISFEPQFVLSSTAGPSGALTEVEDLSLSQTEERRPGPAGAPRP
jgi:hypothetical protein